MQWNSLKKYLKTLSVSYTHLDVYKRQILLIDDHKLIKMGIRVLLEDNKKFSLIDDCGSKGEFLERISTTERCV